MPIFTFDSPSVFYQKNGEGLPVVFLHGFCEDHRVWEPFYDSIPDLMHFADIVASLLRKLNIEKCILIGHSMGGYVSLAFAEKYEHMLLGLGLLHSSPYADSKEKKKKRSKEINFVSRHGQEKYVEALIPKLFPKEYKLSKIIKQLIAQAQQYNPEGIKDGLEAMKNRPDRSTVLERIACPVLCISGEEDAVVPLEKSLQFSSLPNVALVHFLPKVAHMGMFEAPDLCRAAFTEFINYCR